MKSKIIYLVLILGVIFIQNGITQQLSNSSHIDESRVAWNPAYTATGDKIIINGLFRSQWIGFSGAPIAGFASYQQPFTDYNMSAGAIIHLDKTGPVSKKGLQLNYAYHLQEALSRYGQLSLGLSANLQQYSYDGSDEIFNDNGDFLILNSRTSTFFPSIGIGFFYNSNSREYRGNSFFIGAGVNQLFTTSVLVDDYDQVRQKHLHFNIGGRIYMYDSYIEPMLTANLVKPDLLDVLYSLKYEFRNSFWTGIGVSGAGMGAAQFGVIIDEFGNRDGQLRLGILGNYGISSGLAKAGPGVEVYIGYNLATR